MDGEYYSGEDVWEYLKKITGTDLKRFFENLKEWSYIGKCTD